MVIEDVIDFDDIKNNIPLFVLISSTTRTLPSAIAIADSIKEINPTISVIMEGLHAVHFPEQIVKDKSFDVALTGEGESIILSLADTLFKNSDLDRVPGIIYKKDNGFIKNKEESIINLDALPLIDYRLVDMEKYLYRKINFIMNDNSIKRIIRLSFSRGCPYNCPFCLYKSYRYRKMSLRRCMIEIDYLVETFDPEILFFEDATFFANKVDTINFLEIIRKNRLKYKFKIICTARANYFTEDYISRNFIEKYKDIILFWDVGGETASKELLEDIDKKISINDLENVAYCCGQTGVRAGFSFMLGMPGERENDMINTVKFVEKLKKVAKNNSFRTYAPPKFLVKSSKTVGKKVQTG